MANKTISKPVDTLDFEGFKSQILEDFKLASLSRETSLLGRRGSFGWKSQVWNFW